MDDIWSRKQTVALIMEYEKHPLLYNLEHEDRFRKDKRAEAYKTIANEMQIFKFGVSPKQVKKKIKILHQQLAIEKKRMDSILSSGEEYKPKLWNFHYLNFLLNATSKIEPDHEKVTHDYNFSSEALGNHRALCSRKKMKTTVASDEVQQFHNTATNILNVMSNFFNATAKPKTKQQIFCELLCAELQEIKLDSIYDSVTSSILELVRKAKVEERRTMQHVEISAPMPTFAAIPIIDSNIQNIKNEIPIEANQIIFE